MKDITPKKITMGELFEIQSALNVLFQDKSIIATKKKLVFRIRRKCTELLKEYNDIRTSTLDKYSKAEVDGKKFNGYRDKEGMANFEKEMKPLADEEIALVFPKLSFEDIDMDQYTPEDLDILVYFGIVQDDVELE